MVPFRVYKAAHCFLDVDGGGGGLPWVPGTVAKNKLG